MARKKNSSNEQPSATPAKQDETEITAELDAEAAEDGGLTVPEDRIRQEGAVDAESIRDNRRAAETLNKLRGGVKNVPFNVDDALIKYEELTKLWPPNTLDIVVKRLTGSQLTHVIESRPRTGAELYAAIKRIHGAHEEAEYELKFRDSHQKQTRGTHRIVLPNTLDELPPQQPGAPPVNPYFPPPSPYQYPGAAQYGAPQYGTPPAPYAAPPPAPPAPAPPPAPPLAAAPPIMPAAVPAGLDPQMWLAAQQQSFDLMMRAIAQGSAIATPPAQPMAAAPPAPLPAPTPAESTDPLSALIRMFGPERIMQLLAAAMSPGGQAAATPHPPPPPPPPPPPTRNMPPAQPPPGMIWVEGWGFVSADALLRAQAESQGVSMPPRQGPPRGPILGPRGGPPPAYGAPPYRAPPYEAPPYSAPPAYGAPPPAYGPPGDPAYGEPTYGRGPYRAPPPPPPAPQRSPIQDMREAISLVRTMTGLAQEFQGGRPAASEQEAYTPDGPEEFPVQVMDVGGDAKVVLDKKDGSIRPWETAWANLGTVANLADRVVKSVARAQQPPPQPPARVLPPGYVEVSQDYRPPPGYVAVVEGPAQAVLTPQAQPQYAPQQPQMQEEPLPQPPAQMPPPITEPQRMWDAPTFPEGT